MHALQCVLFALTGLLNLAAWFHSTVRTTGVVYRITTLAIAAFPTELHDSRNWLNLGDIWGEVGTMSVTVFEARGLHSMVGKPTAYCVFELDNVRFQTQTIRDNFDPEWNETFTFSINDITSTLNILVYNESFIHVCQGYISIPLLRISTGTKKWYALKDSSKKTSAKGKRPRILLKMTIAWNPIKASLKVISPKGTVNVEKPNSFDVPVIYNNLIFIRGLFNAIRVGHEHYKIMFEWENWELSALALVAWIIFWLVFRAWMAPLLILFVFIYHWPDKYSEALVPETSHESIMDDEDVNSSQANLPLRRRITDVKDLSLITEENIVYVVMLFGKINNLVRFRVPYLSYLAMIFLTVLSLGAYFISFNYLFIALGLYKFTRKRLNPERVPNNELLDFLSRVPDDIELVTVVSPIYEGAPLYLI